MPITLRSAFDAYAYFPTALRALDLSPKRRGLTPIQLPPALWAGRSLSTNILRSE